ncbi:MAG TPA: Calx-beta domain-containing protein [Verrucomicrobiae bacterium]|nr:Calx-beta domain-containing protein [Verrucomicrobiae bacterium]
MAQSSRDTVVELNAVVQTNAPVITLQWNSVAVTTALDVYRRDKGATSWGTAIAALDSNVTSFADSNAVTGAVYEYMIRRARSSAPTEAYGTIVAGCNVPLVEDRGRALLMVDQSLLLSLAPEVDRLERDLVGDGWTVVRTNVARMAVDPASTNSAQWAARLAELQAVRAIVQSNYVADTNRIGSVFILGRLPVPYAGNLNPDGHPDHQGSWPADAYYADVNGTWTDTSVNTVNNWTQPSDLRNRNVPGDGKFDNTTIPTTSELAVGRVDFANMTNVPTGMGEVALLRQYLNRDHAFRHGRAPYASVPRRALIDDGFGYFYGEAFAASGWRNGFTFFGRASTNVVAADWFATLGTNQYLLGYGCGGGSYTSAGGVGTSTYDFARKDSRAVFTMLFGSYFGDWDKTDNFLRSPLAGTSGSMGLTCAWSGRGYFHFDHMAMGEMAGYGMWIRYNDPVYLVSGGWEGNGYSRYVHHNLMGDPTLRLHTVPPPLKPAAQVATNQIALSWQAPSDPTIAGYHVYRGTNPAGPFTRLTGSAATPTDPMGSPIGATTFADSTVVAGTNYTYLIKSIRLEGSASGTYANSSQAAGVNAAAVDAGLGAPAAPTGLLVVFQGGTTYQLTWEDNATGETGYEVQRRDPATGNWSTITTLGADSTSHSDGAAPSGGVVHYRVRANGASANSAYCEATADPNTPGVLRPVADTVFANKATRKAVIDVLRYNGSAGSVGVNYATSDVTATNGVDFLYASGSLWWAHGETTNKTVNVTLGYVVAPQLTRIFRFNLSGATNGAGVQTPGYNYVFISDTNAQSMPAPWTTTNIGALSITGYSEHVSGTFGSTCRSGDIAGTSDNYRSIHQQVSGDVQVTCRVPSFPTTFLGSAKAGVMIRSNMNANAACVAALVEPDGAAQSLSRASVGGNASTPGTATGVKFPCWLRVRRAGTTNNCWYSTNGASWIALGGATVNAGLATNAYVSLGVAANGTSGSEWPAYARFDSVSLVTPPAVPEPLTAGFGASTGEVALAWASVSNATAYRIERSLAEAGPFAEITSVSHPTTSYVDPGLDPATTYYYRVRSDNDAFQSAYTTVASSKPRPGGVAGWRLDHFGSPDNIGIGANEADPDGDGHPNLEEYAFKTDPLGATSRPVFVQELVPGAGIAIGFDRDPALGDIDLIVESSDDLVSWRTVAQSLVGGACTSTDSGWSVGESGADPVRVRVSQNAAQPPEFVRVRVVAH